VDLAEVCEECFDEVHRIGTLRVPRKLRLDPGFGSWRLYGLRVRWSACFVFCHSIWVLL
jgi:hypothetical protein